MPARNVVRPGDLTGRNKAALSKEHAEELARREGEIALINAAAAEEKSNSVVEVKPKQPEQAVETVVEVADVVEVETPTREFRVNTALENMTFGHGNHFDFEEGVRYKAPKALYDHLDSLGYIWH